MKKLLILLSLVCFLSALSLGCGRKTDTQDEPEQSLSIEVEPIFVSETSAALPPPGPYKPTNLQIQTALRNAGYYKARIDGKIGPITDKAIRDFQAANDLKVDGKIGPKTWDKLKRYLGAR